MIVLTKQREIFKEESFDMKQALPKQSPRTKVNPIIDEDQSGSEAA